MGGHGAASDGLEGGGEGITGRSREAGTKRMFGVRAADAAVAWRSGSWLMDVRFVRGGGGSSKGSHCRSGCCGRACTQPTRAIFADVCLL